MAFEDKSTGLFSHYFNDDPLVALPIELGVEDLLPGAEVEFSVGDQHDHLVVDDQRFQVRVAVVFPRLVVLIVLAEGRKRLQPLVDIFDQPALVVVNTGKFSSPARLRRCSSKTA